LKWFRKRHPEFTLRQPQGLEMKRTKALCPENVASLYMNLSNLYDQNKYEPHQVWNIDESGAQACKNGQSKVLAKSGTRAVYTLVPDEREWVTILCAINAVGETIPNFYIFKGKRRSRDYIQLCENHATMGMQSKGWMDGYLFKKWMDHFLQVMRIRGGLSPTQRYLMVLDGHTSHVAFNVIIKAYEAGLDMVILPSHTWHALQPLDVVCFKPFKTTFRVYRDIWSIANKGQQCKKEDLAQWVSLSLKKALTPQNIKAGFKATGILPLDKDRMSAKMGPSEGFNQKAQDIQMEEILEELVPPPKENVMHYYVDIKG
jgi:hypothetical protein